MSLSEVCDSRVLRTTYYNSTYYVGVMGPDIVAVVSHATSVTISWTRPEFSLPEYSVSLTRVTGSEQALCPSVMDNRTAVTTGSSMSFSGLEEFSTYSITVIATFSDGMGHFINTSDITNFTTLSNGK